MDPTPDEGSRVRSPVQLPAELSTPSRARRFAARALRGTTHTALGLDVILLVSELVTNAVLHTAGPITLTAEPSRHLVRIEIREIVPELVFVPRADLGEDRR